MIIFSGLLSVLLLIFQSVVISVASSGIEKLICEFSSSIILSQIVSRNDCISFFSLFMFMLLVINFSLSFHSVFLNFMIFQYTLFFLSSDFFIIFASPTALDSEGTFL